MEINDLLARLDGVKKSGDAWIAQCPAHDDENPSLSVSERDGKLLLHCHAGCSIDRIAQALGLTVRDLFSGNGNGSGKGETRPIIATHDYPDAQGRFLFQKARFATKPKTKPRHKDADGKWRWGAGTDARPLYRLPAILKAQEVCVCEGEKDCDNLVKLGFEATCTPFGKWEKEHAEALKEKSSFVLWDKDDPGRVKRDKAVEFLQGVAKSLRVVDLPTDGKPEGYDVSDFIAEFDDPEAAKEKLCILMSEARTPDEYNQSFTQGQKADAETENIMTPFPETVLSGVAGDFAKLYSSYLESPPEFFFMSFLTCLGSILSGHATLETELKPQSRLYTILLGQSADDRKSTAISKTVEFFRETIAEFRTSWGVGSAEGLQKRFETDHNVLLCLDEFKLFVSKCKIQSSVLLPCVTTLFESNRYENRTKLSEIALHNAHLSLLAASTVQTYDSCWDSQFTDIGFNNRLFLVPGNAKRRFSIPPKIPNDAKQEIGRELQKILGFCGHGWELPITPEAQEVFHEWYMNQEGGSVHTKRLDTYAMRLMLLLSVNEFQDRVTPEIVTKAVALCDWQKEMRQQHDPVDADSIAAKLEEKIRRVLVKGPKSDRELKRYTNAHRSGLWFFDAAKKNLTTNKEITWDKKVSKWRLAA
jgi:hypothetical protein